MRYIKGQEILCENVEKKFMSTELMSQMFILFGLIAIGYISNKTGVLDETANTKLSGFLLKVPLPATVLHSALTQEAIEHATVIYGAAVAIGVFVLLPFMSKLVTRIFHLDKTYQLMLNYSNLGFMGLPIISSVYGPESIFYVVLFMMVFNVHIFSVGIMVLQGKAERVSEMLKKLCSPGIIASIMAFVIVLLRMKAPVPVTGLLGSVGSLTTPLAMIVIGSQLGMVNLLQILKNRSLYLMTFFKLAVYPAVFCMILRMLLGENMVTNIASILMGLPVAGNVTMLCSNYGGDTSLAAQGTCISTFLSLLTVPVLLTLIA